MSKYSFPENMKRIRKNRGISQKMLAEKAQISQQCISLYENSLEYPSLDRLYDIARALDVSVEDLIKDN